MTNTYERTETLLKKMGMALQTDASLKTIFEHPKNSLFEITEQENVFFALKKISSSGVLYIENIENFLKYFDTKKTLDFPVYNLYLSVDFSQDEMILKHFLHTPPDNPTETQQNDENYLDVLSSFKNSFESGYLPFYAKYKISQSITQAVTQDIYHNLHLDFTRKMYI